MQSNVVEMKTKVQRWAEKITAAHGASVQAIIEVGRQLQQAFADCNRGEWGELTGRTTGKSLLPFGYWTAFRLKRVATNTALSNVAHVHHLPASWGTLAELAALDANDIEAAIADGHIHPEMQRKDAEALVYQIKGERQPPSLPLGRVVDLPEPSPDPKLSAEQRAKLDDLRQEMDDKLHQIAELQQGASERRADNAWHAANDPHTRGLALGVELIVGLSELIRRVRDADTRAVLTVDQRIRARAHLNELTTIVYEANK